MKNLFAGFFLLAMLAVPAVALAQDRVAVFPFKNNGQAQLSGLSTGLSAMFTTNLMKSRDLEVVEPQRVAASITRVRLAGGAPPVDDALKAAVSLGATWAVMGEYIAFGNRFRIDIRLYDAATGTIRFADKAQAKEDAMFDMVDELSDKVIVYITGAQPAVGGNLEVNSEPPGALITLDGEKAGETPRTFKEISAGRHRVELTLDGYQDFSRDVPVREKETASVEAKLVRLFGGIRVWWKEYPTSDINISGETISMATFQNINMLSKYCRNLPAGHYRVSVRLPFKDEGVWDNARTWRTYAEEFDLEPGSVVDIFINNNLFSPSLDVGACGPCAADWDFTANISWYEMK